MCKKCIASDIMPFRSRSRGRGGVPVLVPVHRVLLFGRVFDNLPFHSFLSQEPLAIVSRTACNRVFISIQCSKLKLLNDIDERK